MATRRTCFAALALALTVTGCASGPAGSAGSSGSDAARGVAALASNAPAPSVVAVSVDGLNPRAIGVLGPQATPTFHRLMREGTFTLNARTEYELTLTLPNHTGMLTGRRVDAAHGGHGVTINSSTTKTVGDFAGSYVASVFDVVHDAGLSTALFTTKDKFDLFDRTWSAGAPDGVAPDNGVDKVDRFAYREDDRRLTRLAVLDIAGRDRGFTFVHLSSPDKTGHAKSFMSPAYLTAVRDADAQVGRVLRAVDALDRPVVLLVVADHGGRGKGHSTPSLAVNYRVPFFAWGSGVPAGANLYQVDPARQNPGSGRPAYSGPQPVRNGDLANAVTDLLGLGPVPGSQLGFTAPLQVTAPTG